MWWVWLASGYAAFSAGLAGYAAHVSLSATDDKVRENAYRVLKLVWGTGTGGGVVGGLVTLAVKLHSSGLWR
jgi:hypothetical protein